MSQVEESRIDWSAAWQRSIELGEVGAYLYSWCVAQPVLKCSRARSKSIASAGKSLRG